jgi:hypothetical protein
MNVLEPTSAYPGWRWGVGDKSIWLGVMDTLRTSVESPHQVLISREAGAFFHASKEASGKPLKLSESETALRPAPNDQWQGELNLKSVISHTTRAYKIKIRTPCFIQRIMPSRSSWVHSHNKFWKELSLLQQLCWPFDVMTSDYWYDRVNGCQSWYFYCFGNLTSLSLFFFISLIFFYAVLTGCGSACSLLAISFGNPARSHLVSLHTTLALACGTIVFSAMQNRYWLSLAKKIHKWHEHRLCWGSLWWDCTSWQSTITSGAGMLFMMLTWASVVAVRWRMIICNQDHRPTDSVYSDWHGS